MPVFADLALGAAPIAGGALLGAAAGNLRPPDVRAMISKDLDLLERIPEDQVERRARMQASIDRRIDELIEAGDRTRQLREVALSYSGNWRDILVFVCAVLFTYVWWYVDHSRSNWTLTFIVMLLVTVAAAIYAGRGVARAVNTYLHRNDGQSEGA